MLQRITRRAVFRRFAPPAERHRSGVLTLVVVPRGADEGPGAGVAMAVGRKVGSAVVRNRLRRQLRAQLVEIDRLRRVADGWYLLVVHPRARGRSSAELRADLESVFEHAGALT